MWFHGLFGFEEISPDQVRSQIHLEGAYFTSLANGRRFTWGHLETPTLADLRQRASTLPMSSPNTIHEIVADAHQVHTSPQAAGALVQVASQFNLLEMVGPQVTPERGIDIYERDFTQGPACAIACGAGTLYRNYLVPMPNGARGQSQDCQLDCLQDLGTALGNETGALWRMENGYALATAEGLDHLAGLIADATTATRREWQAALRIGLQWDTEVTLPGCDHCLTQAYCSALPVAYSSFPQSAWEPFARFVLEASYEATLLAGAVNAARTGNRRVYLTMIGGGAFGNASSWIIDALTHALDQLGPRGLEVTIVSFGRPSPAVAPLLNRGI